MQARRNIGPSRDPRTTVLLLIAFTLRCDRGYLSLSEQVVESFLARKWITGWRKRRTALDYWVRFNLSLIEAWRHWHAEKPFFVMDYNADISSQLRRLCEKLGLALSKMRWATMTKSAITSQRSPVGRCRALRVYESLRETRNLI
jgi:hypothetical protein